MKNINIEELDYHDILLLKKITGLCIWQLFQMALFLLVDHLRSEIDEYERKEILKDPNFPSTIARRKYYERCKKSTNPQS